MYPQDGSISIGSYAGNLIICDDFQITQKTLLGDQNLTLSDEEKSLCLLFPASEIVTVACHSVVNYHAYSLIEKGVKLRLKSISSESVLQEFGDRREEEK